MCCFFFSSRRRHTRCLSDWSSDVCSSDLSVTSATRPFPYRYVQVKGRVADVTESGADAHIDALAKKYTGQDRYANRKPEIGRASCRERGKIEEVTRAIKKKNEV